MPKIKLTELEKNWNFHASNEFRKQFNSFDFRYKYIRNSLFEQTILRNLEILNSDLKIAGSGRMNEWESGWRENLNKFIKSRDEHHLLPNYFDKYNILRWNQQFIIPSAKLFESNLVKLLLRSLIEKYTSYSDTIYEFGCGTGHNLINLRNYRPFNILFGLDWANASQKIINLYSKKNNDKNIFAYNFDYFNPNYKFNLLQDSIIFTIASLEQTGEKFDKFLQYLIRKKPKIVINIEPIWETLNPEFLIDYLSIQYMKKRNYLDGYLPYLEKLESRKLISILESWRSYLGSFMIDGYSVVVWKPN